MTDFDRRTPLKTTVLILFKRWLNLERPYLKKIDENRLQQTTMVSTLMSKNDMKQKDDMIWWEQK